MLTGEALKSKASGTAKQHKVVFDKLKKLSPYDLDELFHAAHEYVFEETDCLKCANCCKTTPALILPADIKRIASFLKISPNEFSTKYLKKDEDGDMVYKTSPCVFLEKDNTCKIYEVRPQACREYPHTDRKKMKQILDITWENRAVCPAVFDIVEILKGDLEE